jgi:hypothetical protein
MMNKNTTFVIWSYDFDWKIGGYVALHLLAKKLADRGYRVYCTCNRLMRYSKATPIGYRRAEEMSRRNNVVTLYPEVVPGNPLGAKNVVRWVLYYPAGHGVGDEIYNDSELVVTFQDKFVNGTIYDGCPLFSLIDSNTRNIYNMNLPQRPNNAILVKKGHAPDLESRLEKYVKPYFEINERTIHFDKIIEASNDISDLNKVLGEIDYFVSFDMASYHSVFAALAGCKSIIVPKDGETKDSLIERMPCFNYGIAYGFDDLKHAEDTIHLVKNHVDSLQKDNDSSITRLEDAINKRFF